MATRTIPYTGELVVRTCWCGIHHALPLDLDRAIGRGTQNGYCPLGHSYVKKKLDADVERERNARLRAELDQAQAQRDGLRRSLTAQKAATTRLRRRAENGVCPHCNRTFANVVAHIRSKHADICGAV